MHLSLVIIILGKLTKRRIHLNKRVHEQILKGEVTKGMEKARKMNIQVEKMCKLNIQQRGENEKSDDRRKGKVGGGSCLFGWP